MLDELEPPFGSRAITHVRYRVLALAVVMAGITYLDRVCIAQTAPEIRRDLGLSEQQMGFVFSAFTIAYAALRDPERGLGRPGRHAPGPDPHRRLVVELHDRDRRRLQLRVAAGRPVPVRHG